MVAIATFITRSDFIVGVRTPRLEILAARR